MRASIVLLLVSFSVAGTALADSRQVAPQAVPEAAPAAADPAADPLAGLDAWLRSAAADGYRVIVVGPASRESSTPPAASAIGTGMAMQERAMQARARLRDVVSGIDDFPEEVERITIRQGDPWWPFVAIAYAIACLLAGVLAELGYDRWARSQFDYAFDREPGSRADRISYFMVRALMSAVGVAVQGAVAALLVVATDLGARPDRVTALLAIIMVVVARLVSVVFRALLAPDAPRHRLLHLEDAEARSLFRGLRRAVWVASAVGAACVWTALFGIAEDAHTLTLITASLVSATIFGILAIRHRRPVAAMIRGSDDPAAPTRPLPLRLLARTWHVIALVYLAAAWSITTVRLLLGAPDAMGLVLSPVFAAIAGLAAYAIALLVIEKAFEGRQAGGSGRQGFQHVAEHAAGILAFVGALWLVLRAWGVDLSDRGGLLAAGYDIMLVAFLAYIAFLAVKVAVDSRIEEEGGPEEAEPGEEGGAKGTSRLATLLPIFRNFLLIVIAVISGMIILSELGVDIAPLFAGAGVVGLAIGFGAQTLIRDIFSGAFFLVDDAFRRGEYIDIGSVKGTVEKISIRSMQLRHHLGPLHTVPFGEIQYLTNYSRDWVMMKLPLRVTYDTDVDKVRKLIKKLGEELQHHPEIGEKFLQPLKSQGVYQMEDSAMIVRVKFMTRPGDQFQVRKLVYQRIRELFEEHGIRFAHREVTVRLADEKEDRDLTHTEKEAVAGAVLPAVDRAPKPAGPRDDR